MYTYNHAIIDQWTNFNLNNHLFSVFTPRLFYGTGRESPSVSYTVRVNLDSESEDSVKNEIDEQYVSSDEPNKYKLIR